MSRPALAALGLLGVAAVGAAMALISRSEPVTLVPPPDVPPPLLAADVSARAGLAPGTTEEKEPDVITPLTAAHPGQLVVAPDLDEPPLVIDHEDHEPRRPPTAPTVQGSFPRVFTSSGSIVVPLNVRDPAALVMGPGAREESWPAAKPSKRAKPPEAAEPPDVPASVRERFKKADPPPR